jgi:HK97 family phage portal protein
VPQHLELVLRAPQPQGWLQRTWQSLRSIHLGPWNTKDKALVQAFGGGARTSAGVLVNAQTAFTFSAVFDAVLQISSDLAKLPLNLLKRRQDGGSDHYFDSPLYWLLKDEPNPEMGAMVFRRTFIAHALTSHGAFAEIERDNAGRPKHLWPIAPDRVEPFRDELRDSSGKVRLGPVQYRIDGGDTIIPARDMLHITGLGYDPHSAYPLIDKARRAIGLALAAEMFGSTFFGNGTAFGKVFTTDADLSEEQVEEIRNVIKSRHGGPDRAHQNLFLHGGTWKIETDGMSPTDAQMEELRVQQVLEVARFFRIPPHRLGVNTPGTVSYASVEGANIDYYTGPLLDWGTLVEQEFKRKLIPSLERRQQFIKHNFNAFLRGDTVSRTAFYQAMVNLGIFNADMVLELEDLNPQPNGQGKVFLVQGAMVPKGKLEALAESQIEKNKAKGQPPAGPDAGRAERAEQAAADARAQAEAERDKRIEAETRGTVTAEELTRLRESEAKAHAHAEQVSLLAAELRAQVETLSADYQLARTDADQRATEAQRRADQAEAERARLFAEAQAAAERERDAIRDAESARQLVDEARAAATAAGSETERECVARLEAERLQAEATANAERAIAEADRLTQALADAETRAAETKTAADRLVAEAVARAEAELTARQQDSETHAATVTATVSELDDLHKLAAALARERDEARAEKAAIEQRLADADQARVTVETTLQQQRDAEIVRLLNVIAAHRALIVDAMGRMIRRETDRVRKAQATPEKLRAWMESFYPLHRDVCEATLLPVMRTHLGWLGATEDPVEATRALVAQHIEDSKQQLRLVAESADFAGFLEQTLQWWEAERANQFADSMLRKEIEYVRSR